jgi:hypothetical protein
VMGLIGLYNVLLAADQARHAGPLRTLGVSYPQLLRAALALAWGAAFAALTWGWVRRRRWARRWILPIASNYGAFSVLWLIGFAASDFGRERAAFQAALTAALVGLLAWMLRWRRVRSAFEPG